MDLKLSKQIENVDKANKHKRGVACLIKKSKNDYEYTFLESSFKGRVSPNKDKTHEDKEKEKEFL